MIPPIERLGLSQARKQMQSLSGHTARRRPELYVYPILSPPFEARVTLYLVFIPTDTGIGGISVLCFSASSSPKVFCDFHEYAHVFYPYPHSSFLSLSFCSALVNVLGGSFILEFGGGVVSLQERAFFFFFESGLEIFILHGLGYPFSLQSMFDCPFLFAFFSMGFIE